MKASRLLTLSTVAMLMGPGLLRAAEVQRNFDPVQLHEQVRIMAEDSAGEYRERAELNERNQHRLMWDADNGAAAAPATRTRKQAQHRVQSRQRLEERLNDGQRPYESAAYSDAARSWSANQRFGQGYEARMSRGQGRAAAAPGSFSGARR